MSPLVGLAILRCTRLCACRRGGQSGQSLPGYFIVTNLWIYFASTLGRHRLPTQLMSIIRPEESDDGIHATTCLACRYGSSLALVRIAICSPAPPQARDPQDYRLRAPQSRLLRRAARKVQLHLISLPSPSLRRAAMVPTYVGTCEEEIIMSERGTQGKKHAVRHVVHCPLPLARPHTYAAATHRPDQPSTINHGYQAVISSSLADAPCRDNVWRSNLLFGDLRASPHRGRLTGRESDNARGRMNRG